MALTGPSVLVDTTLLRLLQRQGGRLVLDGLLRPEIRLTGTVEMRNAECGIRNGWGEGFGARLAA